MSGPEHSAPRPVRNHTARDGPSRFSRDPARHPARNPRRHGTMGATDRAVSTTFRQYWHPVAAARLGVTGHRRPPPVPPADRNARSDP
ncbi:hypothetical protein MBELCI_2882 [Limimaricola cinnabarinus LL-001]|uniref:Uncharacterized protein n=1 Tax=Limimaricola cinnabarinus LL-001 TaxID=1337093 RepID=U2Z614_9RHOB|nr:hypothetical protein MBELCI_2882 [Limimaricola cinnabarinus LL-001]